MVVHTVIVICLMSSLSNIPILATSLMAVNLSTLGKLLATTLKGVKLFTLGTPGYYPEGCQGIFAGELPCMKARGAP